MAYKTREECMKATGWPSTLTYTKEERRELRKLKKQSRRRSCIEPKTQTKETVL